MMPTLYAARLGLSRGLAEFRQSMASWDQAFNIVAAIAFTTVLVFQRDSRVEDSTVSLAGATLPSMLGMMVALGGLIGVASVLAVHREDGTLLRAKAVPHGMTGYVVGRLVQTSLDTAVTLAIILIPGLFVVAELRQAGLGGWLNFLWVVVLGLLATLPWGAVAGAVAKPQAVFGLLLLPSMGLIAISGIFYPIYAMPGWVQGIAQIFPIYWLGLGTRAALLPDGAAVAEIGQSWRHLETLGVLGVWAIVGLAVAPAVLRRMARRESGSAMEERRQQALQRVA
ncbi:ABC transporter permease [Allorhizocola rhizosphaerae]|uniref:ABC transporter permease n=1 Tax=Allorhizocola rhizosphaerae TaxID=1872709 RepID=UPI000E3B6BD0|nr:ABC transporter permease [Allorhizocola rhizosphaerae]